MIKYFDINDNLIEQSPKNMLRAFKVVEAYAIKNDGSRVDNPEFDLTSAKSEKNKEQRKKRQERFQKESDSILLEIQAMKLLGQNTTAKEQEFINTYNKIKSDLPMVS
jgi:hypothetical protein